MAVLHSKQRNLFFLPTDLQNVNITLRILFRPMTAQLPRIFTSIGEDYDERVLPSITTEVLKSVVVSIIHPVNVLCCLWLYPLCLLSRLHCFLYMDLSWSSYLFV